MFPSQKMNRYDLRTVPKFWQFPNYCGRISCWKWGFLIENGDFPSCKIEVLTRSIPQVVHLSFDRRLQSKIRKLASVRQKTRVSKYQTIHQRLQENDPAAKVYLHFQKSSGAIGVSRMWKDVEVGRLEIGGCQILKAKSFDVSKKSFFLSLKHHETQDAFGTMRPRTIATHWGCWK